MSCCDGPTANPGAVIEFRDLPEETFCCMGRLSYTVAVAAIQAASGHGYPGWEGFNERQKLELGARAKALVIGDTVGDTDIERVMAAVLKAMTTTV